MVGGPVLRALLSHVASASVENAGPEQGRLPTELAGHATGDVLANFSSDAAHAIRSDDIIALVPTLLNLRCLSADGLVADGTVGGQGAAWAPGHGGPEEDSGPPRARFVQGDEPVRGGGDPIGDDPASDDDFALPPPALDLESSDGSMSDVFDPDESSLGTTTCGNDSMVTSCTTNALQDELDFDRALVLGDTLMRQNLLGCLSPAPSSTAEVAALAFPAIRDMGSRRDRATLAWVIKRWAATTSYEKCARPPMGCGRAVRVGRRRVATRTRQVGPATRRYPPLGRAC